MDAKMDDAAAATAAAGVKDERKYNDDDGDKDGDGEGGGGGEEPKKKKSKKKRKRVVKSEDMADEAGEDDEDEEEAAEQKKKKKRKRPRTTTTTTMAAAAAGDDDGEAEAEGETAVPRRARTRLNQVRQRLLDVWQRDWVACVAQLPKRWQVKKDISVFSNALFEEMFRQTLGAVFGAMPSIHSTVTFIEYACEKQVCPNGCEASDDRCQLKRCLVSFLCRAQDTLMTPILEKLSMMTEAELDRFCVVIAAHRVTKETSLSDAQVADILQVKSAKTYIRCPKCKVVDQYDQDTSQRRSADEGMTSRRICRNAVCGHVWRI